MEETGETGAAAPKFSAFLSYSHADARAVQKLHAKLESYRLPKGLGEIAALNAKAGQGLGKVFRDREDLSAAQSLSEAVVDALGRSEVLVVVCSPDAKASRWVAEEIAQFRKLQPGKPILAALVRGEPEEAFPDALTEGGNEPLAADLRREGDGWRLGFLKIVAGIAGVPLDSLIQRDSQRHLRRVMAVTGVAVAAALVMAIMTTVAIQSRNEAREQRAGADSLAFYMMTDLRNELRGVGRLDVMDGVNRQAEDYYRDQGDLSKLPAGSRLVWASVLHAKAEDELNSVGRDIAKAKALLDKAYGHTRDVLAADQSDPDRLFGHGQSEYWLGYVAYLSKDWNATAKHWGEYQDLAAELVALEPTSVRAAKEAGYAAGNMCTLELAREGSLETAERACRNSLRWFEAALKLRPKDSKILEGIANRHAWLADVFELRGDHKAELAERYRGEAIINAYLERDPQNVDWKDMWVVAQIAIAEAEWVNGSRKQAERVLAEAERVARVLSADDPGNSVFKSRLSAIRKIGE